ncbi:MAG TPA: hypothetical protein VIA80_18350, partial [Hyphomonadaceae bacterium]
MSAGRAFALGPLVDLGAVYARKLSRGKSALFISGSEMQVSWYSPKRMKVFLQFFFEGASRKSGDLA